MSRAEAKVVPLRPFQSALAQLHKAGQMHLRDEVVATVCEHLHAGFDGHGVARILQAERLRHRQPPAGGAA